MLKSKYSYNVIVGSEILSGYNKLYHGSTTKSFNPVYKSKEEDIRKFTLGLNYSFDKVIYLDQVHGKDVFFIHSEEAISSLKSREDSLFMIPSSDGVLIKGIKKVLLIICTADCLPVLLYDDDNKIIGGVHAGWRGTKDMILIEAITKMKNAGAKASGIKLWFGPAIGGCCYEVSNELIEEFNKAFSGYKNFYNGRNLDIKALNMLQAVECGILNENIEISPNCTLCEKDTFHSYRHNGKESGRILSFIGLTE